MSVVAKPRLEAAPAETAFFEKLDDRLGGQKAVRLKLPYGGRLHIDRELPFVVIHRDRAPKAASAARGVALASPVYAAWPAGAEADAFGRELLRRLGRRLTDRLGAFVVVELHDLNLSAPRKADSPEPPPYRFEIDSSDDELARGVADRLAEALGRCALERRTPEIGRVCDDPGLLATEHDAPRVSLGVPRAYFAPGARELYPGVLHELEVGVLDALLHALCGVVQASSLDTPRHYRALGRSSFIQAARTVDRKLAGIASAFDFLLSVTPINAAAAWAAFKKDDTRAPQFHYRPLTVDPVDLKRRLFSIRIKGVEDPVLERLFEEKRQELDLQLTLLQTRGAEPFRAGSVMLYGSVDDRLAAAARGLLSHLSDQPHSPTDHDEVAENVVDSDGLQAAALALIAGYRRGWPDFDPTVEVRDDVSGLMVSGPKLLISSQARVRPARVDALLSHEVSVHLFTYFAGQAQGLQIFKTGLAGYEGVQEGLGVFAEYLSGALTIDRLRLLVGRELAVRAMLDGADFRETFRLLAGEVGLSRRTAFHAAMRVHRSGGLAKDAIYLKGLIAVLDHLADGGSLEPFWVGKIAEGHLPVVDELTERGFLSPPPSRPEILSRPEGRARLDRASAGLTLTDLVSQRTPA